MKYLDLARELKKLWNIKMTIPIVIGGLVYSQQKIGTKPGGQGNKRTSGNHPNYCIVKIGKNTEKSPETWGDLLSLKFQ